MTCGIYKIENLINHKIYIGQSKTIEKRWKQEKERAFDKSAEEFSKTLCKAFRKYGIENFSFEIIEKCDTSLLNEKEMYWIDFYNSYFDGYNETKGGDGALWSGISLTYEQIKEIQKILETTSRTNKDIGQQFQVSENTICGINTGYYWYDSNINYPIRKRKKEILYCSNCGKQLSKNYKTNLCQKCYAIFQRKVPNRPLADELKEILLKNNGNFAAVGRLFGVNDNTIRKWCKGYNMPTHTPDYQTNKKIKIPSYPVAKIDIKTDKIIEIYSSSKEAESKNNSPGHIKAVCDGKRKTCNGFKWKYIKE